MKWSLFKTFLIFIVGAGVGYYLGTDQGWENVTNFLLP